MVAAARLGSDRAGGAEAKAEKMPWLLEGCPAKVAWGIGAIGVAI